MRPLLLLCALALPDVALAQAGSTPGTATAPHPTLEHLSIEWPVTGDDDLDGVVAVRYREGGGAFTSAMPLVNVPAGTNEGFSWGHRHAGSIFGLRPDTEYEVELTLTDPDGGGASTTITARTRGVPVPPADARRVDVTPSTIDAALGDLMPGDLVVLGAGTYAPITITEDGTAGRPIVIRGSDVDTVIVDGDVRIDGRAHVNVEALTVNGQIKFNDADHLAVIGCHVNAGMGTTGDGIVSYGSGSTDGYFADNVVIGRTTWAETSLGVDGDNIGEGIVMTGAGNVIEHNRVSGFRDCLSLLEDDGAVEQVSVDFLRNDLSECADDGIEADFSMGNVRVVGNRLTNVFIALSSQPSLGGPTYFVRNVVFNCIFQAFKPNRGSIGDLWLHNTVVKPGDGMGVYAGRTWSRALFRNNLFLGGIGGGTYGGYDNGSGAVMAVADADATCDFDYDGLGSHGTGTFEGRIGADRFASFAELTGSGHEAHATEVGIDVFASSFAFPEAPFPGREPADLRLREGSAAIDRGLVLPNVNDGFAGAAPDLGAYEAGSGPPLYGPRTGAPVCGNGAREVGEECDDANTMPGDGCSATCTTEMLPGSDAGPGFDGGPFFDAGPGVDGGTTTPPASGGCGCRAGHAGSGTLALAALVVALLFGRRR